MDTQRLVEEAKGDVDQTLIESTGSSGTLSSGYFSDGPLVDQFRDGEGVDYALQNLTKGLTVEQDGKTEQVESSVGLRNALLVTDNHLLYVIGQEIGDETFSVPLFRVKDVDTSTGVFKDRITIHTDVEIYDMYVQKSSAVEEVAEHVISTAAVARSGHATNQDTVSDRGPAFGRGFTSTDEVGRAPEFSSESSSHPNEITMKPDGGEPIDEERSDEVEDTSPEAEEEFTWAEPADVESPTGDNSPESTQETSDTSAGTRSGPATKPAASVEVLVSDDNDEPIADTRVSVTGTTFEADGRTTGTGRCRLELPPDDGAVDVVVYHAEYGSLREAIPVVNGGVVDVTLTDVAESDNETASTEGEPHAAEETATLSREELIEELVVLNEESSRKVTRGRMRSKGKYEPEDYETEFGSWSAAVETAPLDEERPKTSSTHKQEAYTKEEVLEAITEVIEEVDGCPGVADMHEYGGMSPSPAYRFFDSWDDAVSTAEELLDDEEDGRTQEAYTRKEVLDAIREVAETVGGRPKTEEMQDHGRMSVGPAYRFFDSWGDAVAAALDDPETIAEDGVATDDVEDVPAQTTEPGRKTDSAAGTSRSESARSKPERTDGDEDPLADGLESAPTGRLSDVVVEVREEYEVTATKRVGEFEVETVDGELVEFVVWEKHELNLDAQSGDRLRFDDVRLARWETDDGTAHQLDSTADLEVTVVSESDSAGGDEGDSATGTTEAVERLVGVGGATEGDAEALVDAGYTTTEDLEAASIEELRAIPDLNDGTVLRIKAEFG